MNAIVGAFFNDHAALRRYLVDEGFLDREAGDLLAVGRARRRLSLVTRILGAVGSRRAAERDLPIGGSARSRTR